jgi:hypothetical protein
MGDFILGDPMENKTIVTLSIEEIRRHTQEVERRLAALRGRL